MAKKFAWVVGFWTILVGLATLWPVFTHKTFSEVVSGDAPSMNSLLGWASVVVGLCVLAMLAYDRFRPRSPVVGEWSEAMETVTGHNFVNEIVQIDGKRFVDCTFLNVTLDFQGQAAWFFERARFSGTMMMRTSQPQLKSMMDLMEFTRGVFDPAKSKFFGVTHDGKWTEIKAAIKNDPEATDGKGGKA
jgi:hypothetical protein